MQHYAISGARIVLSDFGVAAQGPTGPNPHGVVPGPGGVLLVVDNARGELMTGAYANVRLELDYPDVAVSVPASALIFDKAGLRVATVGEDNRVMLKDVTIARDLGTVVEIGTGLTPEDRVVATPPDGVAQGDLVRVITPNAPAARLSKTAPSDSK